MDSFKEIWGFRNLRLCARTVALAVVFCWCSVSRGGAETCVSPMRPFVPSDPEAVKEFRDLIRQDFEQYIRDVQFYFVCLDGERARVFEEAQEVSEDYGRFLGIAGD